MQQINELLNIPIMSMALLGLAGSVGYALRTLPSKAYNFLHQRIITRLVFTAHVFEYDDLFFMLEKWLHHNHPKQYREVFASINERRDAPTQAVGRNIPDISLKQAPNIFIIDYKGKKICIEKRQQTLNNATSFNQLFGYQYRIYGFRGKTSILSLLREVTESYYSSFPKNCVMVRSHTHYGEWTTPATVSVKPLDKIIIDPDLKNSLIEDIDRYVADKSWYVDNSIPYKRTYGLYGAPGTGKTSLCLAMAAYLGRDIYIVNLNSLTSDSSLLSLYRNISTNAIIVYEDIDASFNDRESINKGITFSTLLNCIDGAFYREGVITCITTNHLDQLDPALLRGGRMDVLLEIGHPAIEQINEFLKHFYKIAIRIESDIVNNRLPMAGVQEICIKNRDNPKAAKAEILSSIIGFSSVNKN